jgi:3-phosphoinositide dependent protein kinase-1
LHYTFQNPTTLFFVMDYCANGELFNQLRKHGSFSLDVTRHYLAEIVSALEVIHGKGVMHRDLKPENILLTDTNHIKIIDFGTAKIVGRGRSGSFEGTPEYMSPELLINKECDVRCDLWSLGVMAYQFVTGQLPFRGSTPWETMRKVREREFEYPPKFPETVKDLCEHLLVADPEARLGSKGFDELKTHPFFVGVDWSCLPETTPPPFEPNPDFPKPAGMEPTRRKSNENSDDEFVSDDEASDRLTQSSRSLSGSSSTSTSLSHSSGSLPTVSAVDTAAWAQFLQGEEKIVRAGLVFKKRRAFNVKKRQLILTDAPRMLYVDPSSMKKMGEIPFSSISKAQVKDSAHFIISTKKGRAYNFEDKTKNAQKWVEAINNFL